MILADINMNVMFILIRTANSFSKNMIQEDHVFCFTGRYLCGVDLSIGSHYNTGISYRCVVGKFHVSIIDRRGRPACLPIFRDDTWVAPY